MSRYEQEKVTIDFMFRTIYLISNLKKCFSLFVGICVEGLQSTAVIPGSAGKFFKEEEEEGEGEGEGEGEEGEGER